MELEQLRVEGIGLVSQKDQLDHPGQKAPLDYLCVQEHTLASGNLNRDSPSSVHLARVSLIGINLSYMYPELLKSLKEGPTIPIHFSLRVSQAAPQTGQKRIRYPEFWVPKNISLHL